MRFCDILDQHNPSISFEFFPPKTDKGTQQLYERATELAKLRPSYVSVTYGAGGTTRADTHDLVVNLQKDYGLDTAAHLTCVGHTRDELIDILQRYQDQGVVNIVALRGDAPSQEEGFSATAGGFTYAYELVELIRDKFGDAFGIAVAGYPEGHPETPNKIDDLDHLKRKVDAGADMVITQLFFDNYDFYDFRERCELVGIDIPIIAGIMPVLSRKGIMRMAGLCGSRLPAKLLRRLQKAGEDDAMVQNIGIDWAAQQCRALLDHQVRGIHLYTLNRSGATAEIYRRLGATDSDMLARLAD